MDKQKVIFVALVVITICSVTVGVYDSIVTANRCSDKGGHIVRTTSGNICAEIKEIK